MRTRLLAAILVLAALPVHASIRATLQSPRSGAVLRGGTTATIEWSATGLPADAEEWEAFLSIDGGAFYAYRVTPHLELDQQRFSFEVPNVATTRARLMLRVGDEREEHEIELPSTFTIEADPLRAIAEEPLSIDDRARGESARPGDRGVIQWVEGDRAGRHLETRSAAHRGAVLHELARPHESYEGAEAASSLPLIDESGVAMRVFVAARAKRAQQIASHRIGREVLLTSKRLNI